MGTDDGKGYKKEIWVEQGYHLASSPDLRENPPP
jgi:hypothetical protein